MITVEHDKVTAALTDDRITKDQSATVVLKINTFSSDPFNKINPNSSKIVFFSTFYPTLKEPSISIFLALTISSKIMFIF